MWQRMEKRSEHQKSPEEEILRSSVDKHISAGEQGAPDIKEVCSCSQAVLRGPPPASPATGWGRHRSAEGDPSVGTWASGDQWKPGDKTEPHLHTSSSLPQIRNHEERGSEPFAGQGPGRERHTLRSPCLGDVTSRREPPLH